MKVLNNQEDHDTMYLLVVHHLKQQQSISVTLKNNKVNSVSFYAMLTTEQKRILGRLRTQFKKTKPT